MHSTKITISQICKSTAYLVMWKNDERATTCTFHNDCQKFRVNCTKSGVPRTFANSYIIVALLAFQCLPINMPKFRTTDNPKRHLKKKNTTSINLTYKNLTSAPT